MMLYLKLGTGLGNFNSFLCEKAINVISVDVDEKLIRNAKSKFSNIDNLVLKSGDGLRKKIFFPFLSLIFPILGVRMQLNGLHSLLFLMV